MAAKKLIIQPKVFDKVLALFPPQISFAFAYGSGVFLQQGQNEKKNMMDFVFVVDDPLSWHKLNIQVNKSHYSFLRYCGAGFISSLQEEYKAGVYYNTLIPFEEGLIKYGVVSTKSFLQDLLDWDTLYLSGRLHKPVCVIKDSKSQELRKALSINLTSAVFASLLCLPESFTEKELYLQIAGLSYSGDFRMMVGEDKNKVQNIVEPQVINFQNLYHPLLKTLPSLHWNPSNGNLEQDCSISNRLHYLNLLPRTVQNGLLARWSTDGRYRDMEDVLKVIAHELDCGKLVQAAVQEIVWKSSWAQMFKGILTAGITKSVRYGTKKLVKMVKGMLQISKIK